MKNLSLLTFLTVTLFFYYSCTTPPAEPTVDLESVKTEITAMENAFAEASNAKNVDGVMVYYADDAQSMPPNKPTLVGKEAIKAAMMENMAKDTTESTTSFEVVDLWAAGDMVVETGTWTDTDENGEVVETGKYMSVFEKRDGKYVCIRDIYNSDKPHEVAPIAEAVPEETDE